MLVIVIHQLHVPGKVPSRIEPSREPVWFTLWGN